MPLVRNKMKRNKTSSSENDSRKGQSKYLQFFAKQHKSKQAVKTWIGGYPIFQAAPSSIATCSTNDNISANIPKSIILGPKSIQLRDYDIAYHKSNVDDTQK